MTTDRAPRLVSPTSGYSLPASRTLPNVSGSAAAGSDDIQRDA
jgi:hypothetical protein